MIAWLMPGSATPYHPRVSAKSVDCICLDLIHGEWREHKSAEREDVADLFVGLGVVTESESMPPPNRQGYQDKMSICALFMRGSWKLD